MVTPPCPHRRQSFPSLPLPPCAWPGCHGGVLARSIVVAVVPRVEGWPDVPAPSPHYVEFERFKTMADGEVTNWHWTPKGRA